MGKRGPARTPTIVLHGRGSWLAKTRPNEPHVESGEPPRPKFLSKRAKRIWKQTVPIIPAGVLTLADGGTLAIYCQERARYEEAIEILYEEPPRFQPGSIEHRRLSITCDSAAAMMGRFGAKLGLSPSDRAGMSVPAAKPQNDKSRFFQAG